MRNPALPATHEPSDIQPDMLKCVGCQKVIFNTARALMVRDKLYCGELCADEAAIRRLRRIK